MKALAILAALVLLLPTASFGKNYSHGNVYSSQRCYPRSYVGWGGYAGWGGYQPYGWYAPTLSFSYYSAPRVYRATRYGESYASSLEASVQRSLKRQGYYRGSIDGDIGPGSRAAIRQYQIDHGLDVTGRVDRSLIRSLGF